MVEPSAEMIKHFQKDPTAATAVVHGCLPAAAEAEQWPAKNSVQCVVLSSVLGFIPEGDRAAVLTTLLETLVKGGVLIMTDWPKTADSPDGILEEELRTLLQQVAPSTYSSDVVETISLFQHPDMGDVKVICTRLTV